MRLNELEIYLNQLLDVAHIHDYCPNGLQVEGRSEVRKLISGVTASFDFLQAAVAAGADAVLVHHGYFWRGENQCLTGMKRRRIALLMEHDVSLLAYHLPLDAHLELGNNTQLGRRLGFIETGRFGEQCIAVQGTLPQTMALKDLGINNAIIRVGKRVDDFVYLNVNYRRTGYYVIAKLINGKWTELFSGQDSPSCEVVSKHKIPKDIYFNCY